MKKALLTLLILNIVGCGSDKTFIPDHKEQIDSNTARIEMLEANDSLQDLRLDNLEVKASDLESRMSQAESDIDANENDIADLFNQISDLEDDLVDLRDELNQEVDRLNRADRATRAMLRYSVRSLRRQLVREINARESADQYLLSRINDVQSDLNSFEANQSMINSMLSFGMFMTNMRITQLQSSISYRLSNLENSLSTVQQEIININGEILVLENSLSSMQNQVNQLESEVTEVVYPCGENNSQEVLLKTKDGLVAYFQETRNQTDNFSVGQTIPEHFVCTRFAGPTNVCVTGVNVPSSTASQNISVTHQVLVKAYLDVLADGNYRTTDGYSCNFTIQNGEVL